MIIKHWQGYGRLNAKVVEKSKHHVVIEVSGSHECGVTTTDPYFIKTWLMAKVAKNWMGVPNYMLDFFVYSESYEKAIYTIRTRYGMSLNQALMAH